MKRCIVVVLVCFLTLMVAFGCDKRDIQSDLRDYKITAKAEIDSYVSLLRSEVYVVGEYDDETWVAILSMVDTFKKSVNDATNITQVYNLLSEVRAKIERLPYKYKGAFYSLKSCYNAGILDVDDLRSISFWHGSQSAGGFVPKSKDPDLLSDDMEQNIRETRAQYLRSAVNANGELLYPDADQGDVLVDGYYGVYKGYVAVSMIDPYITNDRGIATEELGWHEFVAGIFFDYNTNQRVYLWRESLEERAKHDYLTQMLMPVEPLATIADVSFRQFLGIYDGCLVGIFSVGQYDVIDQQREELVVDGISFSYLASHPILAYKNGEFYTLEQAFDSQLITKAQLLTIKTRLEV